MPGTALKTLPAEPPQIIRARAMTDIKIADPVEHDTFFF